MESFTAEFEKKRIKKFLKEISAEFGSSLSQGKIEDIFKKSLELLSLPQPNSEILKYFVTSYVLKVFLDKLCEKFQNTELESFQNPCNNYYKKEKDSTIIKYRILGEHGLYPDCELERGDSKYTIINSIPVLMTKNDEGTANSEIAISMNRSELRVATCAMLANSCAFVFLNSFEDYNILFFSKDELEKIPKYFQLYFLHQLLQYENTLKYRFDKSRSDEVLPHGDISIDPKKYEFSAFGPYIDIYCKLFDSYNLNDELLLKTSYYFLKASMLRFNLTFQEESTANVFFCLEGCMHLLQKKYGVKDTHLNLKKLQSIFRKQMPRGEDLFEYIQEAYGKRNELVHAKLDDWGAEWPVPLEAEDLYEYFDVCVQLLNFVLIERKTEVEKEQNFEKLRRDLKSEA